MPGLRITRKLAAGWCNLAIPCSGEGGQARGQDTGTGGRPVGRVVPIGFKSHVFRMFVLWIRIAMDGGEMLYSLTPSSFYIIDIRWSGLASTTVVFHDPKPSKVVRFFSAGPCSRGLQWSRLDLGLWQWVKMPWRPLWTQHVKHYIALLVLPRMEDCNDCKFISEKRPL